MPTLWYRDPADGVLKPYLVGGVSESAVDQKIASGASRRNRLINGDFSVNQRGFANTPGNSTYGHDRWYAFCTGGGNYWAGAPGSGELPENARAYARISTAGVVDQSWYSTLCQKIEGARSLSGKTVTVSFWARSVPGGYKAGVQFVRNFGTGGTPAASEWYDIGVVTLTGSWVRYSVTGSLPAMAGQVEGTDQNSRNTLMLFTSCGSTASAGPGLMNTIGIQNVSIDFWGVQVEEGPVATPFERQSPAEQLLDCQRYYWRPTSADNPFTQFANGYVSTATTVLFPLIFPVQMRSAPTSFSSSAPSTFGLTGLTMDVGGRWSCRLNGTTTGQTIGRATGLQANATNAAYLEFNDEL